MRSHASGFEFHSGIHAWRRWGLALKGTTLLNYDTDGALQKTVRKPQEVMEKLNKGGLQAIKNTFNALSTTETKLNGRLNKETVLIRIFQ